MDGARLFHDHIFRLHVLPDSIQEINIQSVDDHVLYLRDIFKDVQEYYAASREAQRRRLQSKSASPKYNVGERVMIRTSALSGFRTKNRP